MRDRSQAEAADQFKQLLGEPQGIQKIVQGRVIGRGTIHSIARNLLYSLSGVKKVYDCLLALGPSRCRALVGVSSGLSSGCEVLACQRSRGSQRHSNKGQDYRTDRNSIHVDDSRPDAARTERAVFGMFGHSPYEKGRERPRSSTLDRFDG
ncbi:hypothetical protein [Phytohabitans rumicis]|uniref:hypothetical protein n=1 Tax=Phytohabitans rumicis TaxID=1076125 RepID=UPI0015652CF4|nr:hypothetical protein [Phytohabitans rumicis]